MKKGKVFSHTLLPLLLVVSLILPGWVGSAPSTAVLAVDGAIVEEGSKIGETGSSSSGSTIYVPDDYSTIQAAVNAASSGHTIIVRAGVYTENVSVNKGYLTIESEAGAENTIVQAAASSNHVFHVNSVQGVKIRGFTIRGATADRKGGISLDRANSCEIVDNVVSQNWVGIGLFMSYSNRIRGNTLSNNTYGMGVSEDETTTCAVAEAMYEAEVTATPEDTLEPLRALRDQELNSSYVDAYYRYSPDVTRILLSEPDLLLQSARLTFQYGPAVKHVLGQGGKDLKITEEGALEMVSFLRGLRDAVAKREESIGLPRSAAIKALLHEFEEQVRSAEGKMFSEALQESVYCADNYQTTETVYASSSNNVIYLNNFIQSTNARTEQSGNTWNSAEKIYYSYKGTVFEGYVGNYWSSYTGTDADGDGIGDTAYVIDGSNRDNYPLVERFENYVTGPRRPTSIFPKAGDVMGPEVILVASSFDHSIPEAKHAASRWQVARGGQAIHTITMDTGSTTEHLELFHGADGILEPYTSYVWRVRYQDDLGLWSDWSEFTPFTTRPPEDNAGWWWWWGKMVSPQEPFATTIRVKNTGDTTWTPEYRLVLVEGASPDADGTVAVAIDREVAPWEDWEKIIEFTAPEVAGTYCGVWTLQNPDGQFFGDTNSFCVEVSGLEWGLESRIVSLISSAQESMGTISTAAGEVAPAADFFVRELKKGRLPAIVKIFAGGFGMGYGLATDFGGLEVEEALKAWETAFDFLWPVVSSLPPEAIGSVLADRQDGMGKYMYPAIVTSGDSRADWLQLMVEESAEFGPKSYAAAYHKVPLQEIDRWFMCPKCGSPISRRDMIAPPPVIVLCPHCGQLCEVETTLVDGFWSRVPAGRDALARIVHPILVDIVDDHQKGLDRWELQRAFMALTGEEQSAWLDDLEARAAAAEILAERFSHDSDILISMREYLDQPWVKKWLLKVGTTLALVAVIKFGDGPVWLVISAKAATYALSGHSIYEGFKELLGFSDKENLALHGLTTMGIAPMEVRRIYNNAALEPLLQQSNEVGQRVPQLIQGKLETPWPHWFSNEQVEQCWWGLRDCYVASYSHVKLTNLGDEAATFYLIAFYEGEFDKVNAKTLTEKVVQDVPAGETVFVKMFHNLEEGKERGRPVRGSDIRIVALGVNPTGVFFVDQLERTWSPWRTWVTTSGARAMDLAMLEDDAYEDAIEDPVDVFVTPSPADMKYRWQLWLTNPFEEEMTATVRQGLLATTPVQDPGDALVQDGALVWELTIEPADLETLSFIFAYEGDLAEDISLPDVEITFRDAEDDLVLDGAWAIAPVAPLLPILARAIVPSQVLPGEDIQVGLNLTRPGDQGTTVGSMYGVLTDLGGEPLSEASVEFSVVAGEVTSLVLELPAINEVGVYRVSVFVEHSGATRQAASSRLRVGADGPCVRMTSEPEGVVSVESNLTYSIRVQNTIGMPLPGLQVEAVLPENTQVIPGSISHGGAADAAAPHRVWWMWEEELDIEEEVSFTVAVNVPVELLGDRKVERLTAHARATSPVTFDSFSPAATTFVTQAREPLVGTVVGQVVLEGREEHGGAQVRVGNYTTSTDFDGHFALEVPAGNYTVTITRRGFLSSVTLEAAVAAGEIVDLNSIYLAAGEISGELPQGQAGKDYEGVFRASGGTTPYTWEIVAGHLPGGLVLDAETGIISGIPTQVDTFHFTVRVTDDEGLTATRVMSIDVIALAEIAGQTREVGGDILPAATVAAYLGGVEKSSTVSDGAGSYVLMIPEAGQYEVMVSKDGFRHESQWIDIAEGQYYLHFHGDHGMIPDSDMGIHAMDYFLHCMNLYLEDWGEYSIGMDKFLAVMNAYLEVW